MGKLSGAYADIEIVNWDRFNPRSDVTVSSWFRLSHDLFQRPGMHDFSAAEIAAWVFVLCSCSYANTGVIRLSYAHASRVGRLKFSVVQSALTKLERNQMIKILARTEAVTPAAPTNVRTNETYETNETNVRIRTERATFDLISLYRKYPRRLGKKLGLERAKRDVKTEADYQALSQAIDRYAAHHKAAGTGEKYIKHFSSFMSEWRDWLDPETGSGDDFTKQEALDYAKICGVGNATN